MALTKELILQQSALSGLNDDQLSALVTLSYNDETAVIGGKLREVYNTMDANILAMTNISKGQNEKTSEYLSRVAKTLNDKVKDFATIKGQVDSLNAEKQRLEGIIASNKGNEELTTQLNQAKAELKNTKAQYQDLHSQLETLKADHARELFSLQVNNVLRSSTEGIKFKDSLPENVQNIIMQQVLDKVKSYNPAFVDDGNGGTVLVFRNENGLPLNNPENGLAPYTAAQLIRKELSMMDVLDNGRGVKGTGTQQQQMPKTNITGGIVINARTREEAFAQIKDALAQQGLVQGTAEYQDKFDTAWKDNNVSQLPVQ